MASGKPIADVMLKHLDRFQYIKIDKILWELRIENFLENQEYHQIIKKDIPEKVTYLVEEIPRKGDGAFQTFLTLLEKYDHRALVKSLREGERTYI